jgi:tetratricopeptide (TPR) repeat protein
MRTLVIIGMTAALVGCNTPEKPRAHTHLGAILDREEVALDPPTGRTEDDRAKAEGLVVEGAKLRDSGDLAGSQAALEEALRLDASLARAHVEWAMTAEALAADPALISAHYQLGARLAPEDSRAQLLAAAWAARQGDDVVALEAFDRAVAADPTNVEAVSRRADLKAVRGDLDGAINDYRLALGADAAFVPAWVGLADVAERAKDNNAAEEAHKSLVKMYPDATHYRGKLVAFYRRTGQSAKEAQAKRELEKIEPKDTRKLRKLRK